MYNPGWCRHCQYGTTWYCKDIPGSCHRCFHALHHVAASTVTRLDIVWDRYVTESLKAVTRSKRGSGVRRHVEPASTIPGNWQAFLRIDENKTELFSFLATKIATIETRKQVVTTHDLDVLCINTNQQQVSTLTPCTHEEADTHMLLHLKHAVQQGNNSVSIRTVDTDVVVLAVTAAECLSL